MGDSRGWLKGWACILAAISSHAVADSGVHPVGPLAPFGIVDASIEYAKGSKSIIRVRDGENTASRFGFTSKEDIGGGLSATMWLEAGFNIDTGAELYGNGTLFGRQAFVGLLGSSGEIRLGRQYTPAFWALLKLDPLSLNGQVSAFKNMYSVASQGTGYVAFGPLLSNVVEYLSPDYGPFSFSAFFAPGEVSGNSKSGLSFGANVVYETKEALMFYAYQGQRGAADVNEALSSNHFAGGSYKFGPFKLGAALGASSSSYQNTRAARLYAMIFSWDVTASDTIKADLTKRKVLGAQDAPLMASVGLDHAMSKRTSLYSRLVYVHNSPGGSATNNAIPIDANSGDSGQSINFGIIHRF